MDVSSIGVQKPGDDSAEQLKCLLGEECAESTLRFSSSLWSFSFVFLLLLWCHSPVGTEEEVGGNRQRHNRHARDPAPGSLERRIDELEKVRA